MGCFSSKHLKQDSNQEAFFTNPDYRNHIVSLTSTTYGILKLDSQPIKHNFKETRTSSTPIVLPRSEEPEVINTWELMKDLEDDDEIPITKRPNSYPSSPKKRRKFTGKENKKQRQSSGGRSEGNPLQILKPLNSLENIERFVPALDCPSKSSTESFSFDVRFSPVRQSFSPLFDPELVAFYERELEEEGEQIKNIVFAIPRIQKVESSNFSIGLFEKKSPPGGDNAVIIYTTTLRGIRKTYEDCNIVRSVIESHCVYMIERDISMDSRFREELRVLTGKKGIRVPMVFVKGRLIGGIEEVVKLEEEGKLGLLFEGIPKALSRCDGCAGMRFVMCMECSGSCKVLDEEQNKMVKCGECNENGLIQCPICC